MSARCNPQEPFPKTLLIYIPSATFELILQMIGIPLLMPLPLPGDCINNMFYIGTVDTRNSLQSDLELMKDAIPETIMT